MITVEDFLKIEGNSYAKNLLLETIKALRISGESKELTFNVFSINIIPKKNEVVISDDICPDENPAITVPLNEFFVRLKKSIKNITSELLFL